MTLERLFVPLIFSLTVLFTLTSVQAAERKSLGSYRDWEAYRVTESGKKVCYVASLPRKMEGKYKKRGDVVAFVTHRPAHKERDVVSFVAGYAFKKGSSVEVAIDGRKFSLFTKDDTAWARSEAAERAIVAAALAAPALTAPARTVPGFWPGFWPDECADYLTPQAWLIFLYARVKPSRE